MNDSNKISLYFIIIKLLYNKIIFTVIIMIVIKQNVGVQVWLMNECNNTIIIIIIIGLTCKLTIII